MSGEATPGARCPCPPGGCFEAGDTLAGFSYDRSLGRHHAAPGRIPPPRPLPTTIPTPAPWPTPYDVAMMTDIIQAGAIAGGPGEAARRALAYRPLVPREIGR